MASICGATQPYAARLVRSCLNGLDSKMAKDYWEQPLAPDALWAVQLDSRTRLLGKLSAFGLFMSCPVFGPYSSYASRWLFLCFDR